MLDSLGNWLSANWQWLAAFVLMVSVAFILMRLQTALRDRAAQEIQTLLRTDPATCAERLENNRLLKLIFRKQVISLWLLDAYMLIGQQEKTLAAIQKLDKMRLEPRDKLEFYQKRLSYYAASDEPAEARKSRDQLYDFMKKTEILETEPYSTIMEEADLIIGIYVDKNTGLIKKLIGRAEHTKNDIMRGVTQFRIAKLAYFKGDQQLMTTYLSRAAKNLKGTWYAPIIAQAQSDPTILEHK